MEGEAARYSEIWMAIRRETREALRKTERRNLLTTWNGVRTIRPSLRSKKGGSSLLLFKTDRKFLKGGSRRKRREV